MKPIAWVDGSVARFLFVILGFHKPSSKKRVLDSVAFLERRGHRVLVREFPKGVWARMGLIAACSHFDCVVLQKKMPRPLELAWMRRLNPRIVFDVDDAVMFHEIERNEPVTGVFFRRFAHTVARCRGVITGNAYLAEFARAARDPSKWGDGSVLVLPTPVDTSRIPERRAVDQPDPLVIGWIGTRGNLRHLERIAAPLAAVCGRHRENPRVICRVVSDSRPDLPGVPFEFKPWSADSETADLQGFDIGIMPLGDDLWTRGKGGFKLLQYMAAGAAAVASPVGINREIVRHGENGLLAKDEKDWEQQIELLVVDPKLRECLAREARRAVQRDFSLDTYNERLATFLEGML